MRHIAALPIIAFAFAISAVGNAGARADHAKMRPNRVLTVDQLYELFYLDGHDESHQPGRAHLYVSGEFLRSVGPDQFDNPNASGAIIVTGTKPLSHLTEEPRPGATEVLCEYGPSMAARAKRLPANTKIVMRGIVTFADNVSDTAGETVAMTDCTF